MVAGSRCSDVVKLRGLTLAGVSRSGPVILKRADQEFLQAVLGELAAKDGLVSLDGDRVQPPASGEPLRLFQPVHRIFNLAMLEVTCDCYGQPRLDPQRIESAGLVVRREWQDPQDRIAGSVSGTQKGLTLSKKFGSVKKVVDQLARQAESAGAVSGMLVERQELDLNQLPNLKALVSPGSADGGRRPLDGWMQSGKQIMGWVRLASPISGDLDPDPQQRRPAQRAGHPFIDQLLSASGQAPLAENVTRLFVAPPEVCRATGKTILYGVLPVTSSEQSETADLNMPPFSDKLVALHLPSYLRAGGPRYVPRNRQSLDYRAADTRTEQVQDTDDTDDLADFIGMLRQLAVEFGAFDTPLASNPVYQALNSIQLAFTKISPDGFTDTTSHTPAGDFLKDATDVLVLQRGRPSIGSAASANPPTITMPDNFPVVTPEQAAAVVGVVKQAMVRRLAQVAGREGRFDEQGRLYRVRAFVRLKGEAGCPPETVWSDEYSEPFTIVPWYESSGAPPTQVTLPEITPEFLKNLKPNVSFVVPESLFNLLNKNSPSDFINGQAAQAGAGLALDWICSFNIPIITICAFIVLNIFLQLFDIIFHWLMFIKICIPFPKSAKAGPP
jgi:hypothetical protein